MIRGAALSLEGFSKAFGKVVAVQDLSLVINRGESVGLVGPNGAGKTTVLRAFCGFVRPSSGNALVLGEQAFRLSDPGGSLSFVFDPVGLDGSMSGRMCLRLEARMQGLALDRVAEMVELFSLGSFLGRKVSKLSSGQRQRVALACACLGDPEVLILDEPTNGLDVESTRWLRELVIDRKKRGKTTVVSSHVLGELSRMVDRVVVFDRFVRFDGVFPEGSAEETERWYLSLIGDRVPDRAVAPGKVAGEEYIA